MPVVLGGHWWTEKDSYRMANACFKSRFLFKVMDTEKEAVLPYGVEYTALQASHAGWFSSCIAQNL